MYQPFSLTSSSVPGILEQLQEAIDQADWANLEQWLEPLLSSGRFTAKHQVTASQPAEADSQLLQLMIAVLRAGDFQTRWHLTKIFPILGPTAIDPLIRLLQDEEEDEELRWFAAKLLGEFDHPEVVKALLGVLRDSAPAESISEMAVTVLASMGTQSIASLTELLADPNSRVLAVRALAQIRRSETIGPLLQVVTDPDPAIRIVAIEALSSFHDAQIPPVLFQALSDSVAEVRREAVIGLSFRPELMSELNLVKQFQHHLKDESPKVCEQAARALARCGTEEAAIALFQRFIESPISVLLQIDIIQSLGWIGTAAALDYLRQILTQSGSKWPLAVYQEGVTVLGRVSHPEGVPQAAQLLIDLLHSNHLALRQPGIRQTIALGLGQLGQEMAVEPLVQLLSEPDPGVRLHTIAALKQLNAEQSWKRLKQLSQQSGLTVEWRQGIEMALQEWS